MPACSTCDSGLRATVEALAQQGLTPTKIHERLDGDGANPAPSISSIRRHLEAHWQRPAISIEPAKPELDAAEAVSGLYSLWDSAEAVRVHAEARGDSVTALRAGEQGIRVLVALARSFGINSKTVADHLQYARDLTMTIGIYGRENPEVTRAIAEVAQKKNYTDVVRQLHHFAEAAEKRQKENHGNAAA